MYLCCSLSTLKFTCILNKYFQTHIFILWHSYKHIHWFEKQVAIIWLFICISLRRSRWALFFKEKQQHSSVKWAAAPSYLRFMHPNGFGSFTICRTQYVRREQRHSTLTVIQAGKVVLVFIALAYWLVPCCTDTPWGSFIIEEMRAVGKVIPDLSGDQAARKKEKQSYDDGLEQTPNVRHLL